VKPIHIAIPKNSDGLRLVIGLVAKKIAITGRVVATQPQLISDISHELRSPLARGERHAPLRTHNWRRANATVSARPDFQR
jgi:hypothetical protein